MTAEDGRRKVLVVEDDVDVRDLVVLSLNHAGFDVLVEGDGAAGLDLALEEQPDLVILDWMMPRLSGVEVCRALRADPRAEGTSVLLLTSRAQEGDIDQGFEAGANDYMVKPFRGRELVSRVDSLLAQRRRLPVPPA
jgi:DNA-binding response OmpR family regulator